MRFELHIVFDLESLAWKIKRWWIHRTGKPSYHEGKLVGHVYKDVLYMI